MKKRETEGYRIPIEKIRKVLESEEFIKEYYLKRDELLFKAKLSQGQSFSKYTFATAAVALSASLTLIKLFHSPALVVFLGFAWFFFSLAMLSSLLSILASMDAMDQQTKQMIGEKVPFSIGSLVDFFNFLSLILIAIGLLFVLIFSCINLNLINGSKDMKKENKIAKTSSKQIDKPLLKSGHPKKLEKSVKPTSLLIIPAQPGQPGQNQNQNSNSSNSSNQEKSKF